METSKEDPAPKKDPASKKGFVRINALRWADILVLYATFVMQDYLTDVWKLSFTHAAGILNIWGGITKILPLLFLFLVDTILGNFKMLVISSISYSVGIGLLTMSTPSVLANSTGTCKQDEPECIGQTQKVFFYTGMALIAIGVAGNLVSVDSFSDKQDDDKANNIWFKIFGFIIIVLVPVVGAIALPYVKPWTLRFGIPAICTVVATLLFLTGSCRPLKFTKDSPEGSPITHICRVFVAASFNICKSYPANADKYHKREKKNESFKPTRFLRCLEKAAIEPDEVDQVKSRWKLCYVDEVEEAKIAVRMVPMWMTFVVCGIVSSVANTYFVEQANNMNRRVGKLKLPPQILLLISDGAKIIFRYFSNCLLGKAKSKKGGKPTVSTTDRSTSKIAPAIGIGIGMALSILCCIVAALVEIRRLQVVRRHGLLDKPDEDIPMNILWLVFQFVLLTGLDLFLEESVKEFYEHQSPPSMKDYLEYFTRGVSGLGFMCSVLSVYVVGKISEKGGRKNWFQFTLNKSRLDRYYWVLAGLSSVNLLVFILVATFYRYKSPSEEGEEGGEEGEDAISCISNSLFSCC